MLVLSRKIGEQIVIKDPSGVPIIYVMVTGVHGNQVGVGIDAPIEYNIARAEVDDGRPRKCLTPPTAKV